MLTVEGGLPVIKSRLLSQFPELLHAVTTRAGGFSAAQFTSLNLAFSTGDNIHRVARNRYRVISALGLHPMKTFNLHQMLGAGIVEIAEEDVPESTGDYFGVKHPTPGDIIVSETPGIASLTLSADCNLSAIYCPIHRVFANIHASRQGTYAFASRKAAEYLVERFDCKPEHMIAYIGPSVGKCCYTIHRPTVDVCPAELRRFVSVTARKPGYLLDIKGANVHQLLALGIPKKNIEISNYCTQCMYELFFSYRRDGTYSGRFGCVMMLRYL